MNRSLAVAALILLCTACAVSRPTITYLQLQSLEQQREPLSDSPVVSIDAIAMPDYLLRDELVRRLGAVRLTYDHSLRWAEPLDLGIQRVLARELESRMGTRQVIRFPAMSRRTPDWLLDIEIFAFEARDSEVVIHAEGLWATGATPDATVVAVDYEESASIPTDASAETVAETLSVLLHGFAGALVSELQESSDAAFAVSAID